MAAATGQPPKSYQLVDWRVRNLPLWLWEKARQAEIGVGNL